MNGRGGAAEYPGLLSRGKDRNSPAGAGGLRLVGLSLPLTLLLDDRGDPDWYRQTADEKLFVRAVVIRFRARAYTLRGDAESARECFRQGVELLAAAPAGRDAEADERRDKLLAEFRAGFAPPPQPE